MSTIPASYIVAINPRLIPAGGTDLEFNGLFLTENALIPADAPLMAFTSAETVSAFFGETSNEYAVAAQYFLGYNNSFSKPRRLMFGRRISAAVGAWIRGAKFMGTLADVKAVTSGRICFSNGIWFGRPVRRHRLRIYNSNRLFCRGGFLRDRASRSVWPLRVLLSC